MLFFQYITRLLTIGLGIISAPVRLSGVYRINFFILQIKIVSNTMIKTIINTKANTLVHLLSVLSLPSDSVVGVRVSFILFVGSDIKQSRCTVLSLHLSKKIDLVLVSMYKHFCPGFFDRE